MEGIVFGIHEFQDPPAVAIVADGCPDGPVVGDVADGFGFVERVVGDHPFGRVGGNR